MVVPQKPHIFLASVSENIAYNYPSATQAEIETAARLANADEFIQEFSHGYKTIIGGREPHLSGGQCQRITLARAMIRNPDVVILDEPTNSLDSISTETIRQSLQSWGKTKTVVMVAHNLETVQHADVVLLLDRGQIRAIESFHSLYRSQGYGLLQHLLGALNP